MVRELGWLLTLLLLIAPSVQAQGKAAVPASKPEQELLAVENEAVSAMIHADMVAIDRIFSDDWIIIDEEAEVRDKKVEFDAFRTGEEKIIAGQLGEMKVRLFGEAGVVTGSYIFKGSFKGKPFDIKGRFTDVFVKQNGHWRCVSSHNSGYPKPRKADK